MADRIHVVQFEVYRAGERAPWQDRNLALGERWESGLMRQALAPWTGCRLTSTRGFLAADDDPVARGILEDLNGVEL